MPGSKAATSVYETKWKINLLTVFGLIEMVLCSGVIYGWANMVVILKDQEYFRDLCAPGNATAQDNTDKDSDEECTEQDDRLALVFIIAAFSFSAAGFLGGVLFDNFGTRVTRLVACYFFFLAGLFSYFLEKDSANLIFPVMVCLAFAGMLVAISLFQIAVLHPNHTLAVSSSFSGSLDSSSIVFLIFKVCYDATGSLRWMLMCYIIIAMVIVLGNTFLFLPTTSIALELDKLKKVGHSADPRERSINSDTVSSGRCGERPSKDLYRSGWRYLLTGRFLWLFYYLAFVQLRLWFFVASLYKYLVYHTDNDKGKIIMYSKRFGIAQFFGFCFAPLTGIIMDLKPRNISNPFLGPILSFITTNCLCLLLGGLVLVPILEVQYASFVIQVAMRAFLYASLISFILRAHYGKLYGVCSLGGALVMLLMYPATVIMNGPCHGNPFWVNAVFLVLSLSGFGLPLYLWLSNRRTKPQSVKEPDESARLIQSYESPRSFKDLR